MKLFFLIFFNFTFLFSIAQVAFDNVTPNSSAILDLSSSHNKGFLLPRLSTSERNASDGILSPVGGILIYDTTLNCVLISMENGKWKNTCSGVEENTTAGTTSSTPKIGIGIALGLDNNTALEIVSKSKGVLLPIAASDLAPVTGLLYYNTSDDTVRVYNGSSWISLTTN